MTAWFFDAILRRPRRGPLFWALQGLEVAAVLLFCVYFAYAIGAVTGLAPGG